MDGGRLGHPGRREGESVNVAWCLQQIPEDIATPEMVYDLYRRHRLVPDSVPLAVSGFQSLAATGQVFEVIADGTKVATIIISAMVPGERADVDMVPLSKFFRGGYEEELRAAMEPIWEHAFEVNKVRRLTSSVPRSRARTVKALKAMGFKIEGVLREGAKIVGHEPEDLILMGLLPQDLED